MLYKLAQIQDKRKRQNNTDFDIGIGNSYHTTIDVRIKLIARVQIARCNKCKGDHFCNFGDEDYDLCKLPIT